jgi:Xaa-Pro aminopeptidase
MNQQNSKTYYIKVASPDLDNSGIPVAITDQTIIERQDKILALMKQKGIDSLVVYGDLEHGSNFEYLAGFLPRFEEAMLVLHKDGNAYLLLGNENANKAKFSRIPATGIHVPFFSLPNQPMENEKPIHMVYEEAGIQKNTVIGVAGWKLFTSSREDNAQLYDIPYYLLEGLKKISQQLINCTDFFIDSEYGARATNNANEIAHYEFGASLASDAMLQTMDRIELGTTEMELGNVLNQYGQRNSVVTIAAAGQRFIKANIYPTDKKISLQDPLALTVGYKGGLSSRVGYVVHETEELPKEKQEYLPGLVSPYFKAIVTWLENAHCGMSGSDLYNLIDKVLPKKDYHWTLCPGHLTSDEEWMSSPIYEGSNKSLQSGMIFQTDIIPSIPELGGVSAESTVALADNQLKESIQLEYPELWQRIQKRRDYIKNELNINIHEDLLPMASTLAYLRPYFLNKEFAMRNSEE